MLPVSSAGKERVLQRTLPPGAAEGAAGVCPVSRIGHPCGNLHRAGLTGRPLAGVPSDLRCSRMRFRVRDDRAPTSVSARLTVDPATVNPRWLRRSEGALCTSRRCQWQWPLRGVGTAHRGGLSRQVCAEFASLLVTAKLDTPAQLVLFSREGHLLNVLSGESLDGECV